MNIDVYHFNEGHAIFAGFELLQEKMQRGLTFDEAIVKSKEEIVFTTHTPIVEGNESHYIDRLMYMGANNGLTIEQLVSLGGSPFNMTVAALKLSRKSNSVAQLHNETANKMWAHVKEKSDIVGITNAIHLPTWVDNRMITAALDNKDIWEIHMENKKDLIDFVYERNGVKLDKDKLLIGFSRRAAPYKRSDFIFTDESVVDPLFSLGSSPVYV